MFVIMKKGGNMLYISKNLCRGFNRCLCFFLAITVFYFGVFSIGQQEAVAQEKEWSPWEARNEELDSEAERIMAEYQLRRKWAEEDCKNCGKESQKRCRYHLSILDRLEEEARGLADGYIQQQKNMEENAQRIYEQMEQLAQKLGLSDIAGRAAKSAAGIAAGAAIGSGIGGPIGAAGGIIFSIGSEIVNLANDFMNSAIDARDKEWIKNQYKRQGEEIKKAGELIKQFKGIETDIRKETGILRGYMLDCDKKKTPEAIEEEDISHWEEASKEDISDSCTGEPLDGGVIVIPEDPDGTPTKPEDYTDPDEGDTVIVFAPCHTKKVYVVGRDNIPKTLTLDPKPLEFIITRGDKRALENIRKSLARQGITYNPNDVEITPWISGSAGTGRERVEKHLCKVTITKYTKEGQCPEPLPGPTDGDASSHPPCGEDGGFEGNEEREGQEQALEGFPRDPFYHSRGSWGQKYDDQWALKRIGFSMEKGKPNLWPERGHPIIVAVIDTGLDIYHPELIGATWINRDELAGNGKDDDNNGYIDDYHGWNFVDNNNDISDNNGHGTLVAGIIAAWTDNGVGIAGVNPWARIMPIKITDFNNKGGSINLAKAITYAVDNGARIINLSVGGKHLTFVEQVAINYARKKGALIIVAAGNKGENTVDFSPAGLEGVITVASTDTNDKRVGFSNWGKQIDICAPGVDILSLRAPSTDYLIFHREKYKPGFAFVGKDKKYYRTAGSSFSAPFVSSVASLILTKNPKLTGEEVTRMIIYSARDIDVPGRDQYTGYGLLDAKAALAADPNFFLEVQVDGVKMTKKAGKTLLQVMGTVDADQLKEAWVEIGAGSDPKTWKVVSKKIKKPVTSDLLGTIAIEEVKGSKLWIVRLVAEHKNGQRREARYVLRLK